MKKSKKIVSMALTAITFISACAGHDKAAEKNMLPVIAVTAMASSAYLEKHHRDKKNEKSIEMNEEIKEIDDFIENLSKKEVSGIWKLEESEYDAKNDDQDKDEIDVIIDDGFVYFSNGGNRMGISRGNKLIEKILECIKTINDIVEKLKYNPNLDKHIVSLLIYLNNILSSKHPQSVEDPSSRDIKSIEPTSKNIYEHLLWQKDILRRVKRFLTTIDSNDPGVFRRLLIPIDKKSECYYNNTLVLDSISSTLDSLLSHLEHEYDKDKELEKYMKLKKELKNLINIQTEIQTGLLSNNSKEDLEYLISKIEEFAENKNKENEISIDNNHLKQNLERLYAILQRIDTDKLPIEHLIKIIENLDKIVNKTTLTQWKIRNYYYSDDDNV